MARNGDYKALIITSDPGTIAEVTEIAGRNFENVSVLFWEMGNRAPTKPEVIRQIEETDYNLIISYINGIILSVVTSKRLGSGPSTSTRLRPSTRGCGRLAPAGMLR